MKLIVDLEKSERRMRYFEGGKIHHVSHTDLDGLSCIIISRLAFGKENVIPVFTEAGEKNVDEALRKIWDSPRILVSDVTPSAGMVEALAKKADDGDSEILIVDHHKSAIEGLREADLGKVASVLRDDGGCATKLLYDHLRFGVDLRTPELDKFVAAVDAWDIWNEGSLYRGTGVALNNLLGAIGRKAFLKRGAKADMTNREMQQADEYAAKIRAEACEIAEGAKAEKDEAGRTVVVCEGDTKTNSLIEFIQPRFEDADYLLLKNPAEGVANLRSLRASVDVSEIAKQRGGGGHKASAGYPLKKSLGLYVLEKSHVKAHTRTDSKDLVKGERMQFYIAADSGFDLLKVHVKQHYRTSSKTGQIFLVKDYEDKRRKQLEETNSESEELPVEQIDVIDDDLRAFSEIFADKLKAEKIRLPHDEAGWNSMKKDSSGLTDLQRVYQDSLKELSEHSEVDYAALSAALFWTWSGSSNSISGAIVKSWARMRFGGRVLFHTMEEQGRQQAMGSSYLGYDDDKQEKFDENVAAWAYHDLAKESGVSKTPMQPAELFNKMMVLLDMQYHATQKSLENFSKKLTLYRGIGEESLFKMTTMPPSGLVVGNNLRATFNPAVSFSNDPERAIDFAKKRGGASFRVKLDKRNILSHYGINHAINGLNESEYIVAANNVTGMDAQIHFSVAFQYDADGYDAKGYNKEGYDRRGMNKFGLDEDGFSIKGYDKDGFDPEGFDKTGYNRDGYDVDGYDKAGYDSEGYDLAGFNFDGYNRNGFDKWGYSRSGRKQGASDAVENTEAPEPFSSAAVKSPIIQGLAINKWGYDEDGFDVFSGKNAKGAERDALLKEKIGDELFAYLKGIRRDILGLFGKPANARFTTIAHGVSVPVGAYVETATTKTGMNNMITTAQTLGGADESAAREIRKKVVSLFDPNSNIAAFPGRAKKLISQAHASAKALISATAGRRLMPAELAETSEDEQRDIGRSKTDFVNVFFGAIPPDSVFNLTSLRDMCSASDVGETIDGIRRVAGENPADKKIRAAANTAIKELEGIERRKR
jgi:oligoribonuclease NrnB/cAMP/cGMP phosphodiesterase (DHH superfamily)